MHFEHKRQKHSMHFGFTRMGMLHGDVCASKMGPRPENVVLIHDLGWPLS